MTDLQQNSLSRQT